MTIITAILLAAITVARAMGPNHPDNLPISGKARVIDGDTLVIERVHIRLYGIDAPEAGQRCDDEKGRAYNCGDLAADVLQEEIGASVVTCFPVDKDRFRRIVAVCTANDQDLGKRMVERGYAIDYAYFSGGRYGAAEREAREARRGMWAGKFQEPRQWRQEQRR